jgi:diguanylate cyclase (GGDEF)-like protein/PAS domain S-box-containing protein
VLNNAAPVTDSSGKVIAGVVVFTDITEGKQAVAALLQEKALLRSLIDAIPDLIFIKDENGVYLDCNKAAEKLMGLSRSEQIGKTDFDFFDRQAAEIICSRDREVITGGVTVVVEEWATYPDGTRVLLETTKTPLFGAGGQIRGMVGVCRDITERKAALEQIRSLAFTDTLTGLPNRRLLMDRLEHGMAAAARHQNWNALLFIDLDDFKTINDTLGHDKGDKLLREIANRLLACVREGDTVARLGGDEFVVLIGELDDNLQQAAKQAQGVATKIHNALGHRYHLDGHEHESSASIGVTLFGDAQRENIEEPLKRAELAMYQAKAVGRNTLRFFEPEMQAAVTRRATLEADLREAMTREQFLLHYQPQVGADARLTGVEALLRWRHPQRGLISPAEFIPVAEASGLILSLGRWVLKTACKQLALWALRPELAHLNMAVNVSAHEFRQLDFIDGVVTILNETGARAQRLTLELTESVLVHSVGDIVAKMDALKAKGVGFSIDDFGTGYSSLSYLKRLPLDQLKIDMGFVRDILTDPNDAAIARMVVVLAESLGLDVIAEGVETEAQRDLLASMGCRSYQGYLFSRPLPIAEFEAYLLLA